ncbi:hypothetical protein DVH24_004833 [Malus domestica]|uniref:Uncharacterized protein n=1 Tax=Malus domestica TaxID=3750 RepID=A0A498ID43_MALDO|nr:hypothetical protein DVH24_004833 [Malus domestica]
MGQLVRWRRPSFGVLKINCDGTWCGKTCKGGYGWRNGNAVVHAVASYVASHGGVFRWDALGLEFLFNILAEDCSNLRIKNNKIIRIAYKDGNSLVR